MKNILAGLMLSATFALASAQTISFNETTHDYGTIAKGSDGHTFFTVTNSGDKPLIISRVQPACGCTTPEFSQDPIMPGKSAKIKVGYNTQLENAFQKLIEVYSNDPVNSRSVIYIKGVVAPDPNAVAAPVAAVAYPTTVSEVNAVEAPVMVEGGSKIKTKKASKK